MHLISSKVQDHNKSIVYHERQLSVAKEIKDLGLESDALHGLGYSYGRVLGTGTGRSI